MSNGFECDAEIVAGFGIVRPEGYRRPQRGQRALEILRPPAGRPEVILRIEERGRELHGTGKLGERPLCISELTEHEAAPIVGFRHFRRVTNRVGEERGGTRQILAPLGNNAEQVVGLGRRGTDLERRPQACVRAFEIVSLEISTRGGEGGRRARCSANRSGFRLGSIRRRWNPKQGWRHDPDAPRGNTPHSAILIPAISDSAVSNQRS